MTTAAIFVRERTDWAGVLTVVVAGVVAAMQVGKGLIAGPLLQFDLGLDLSALGWITSVFAIVGVVVLVAWLRARRKLRNAHVPPPRHQSG